MSDAETEQADGDEELDYEFGSPRQLLGVANRRELQASEKPLLTPTVDNPAELESFEDVEFVDDWKLVYNQHSGRTFGAVTDEYEIINPGQFVGPLTEELLDRDRNDVEGQLWVRNGGANAYAQVLFRDTHSIHLPGRGRSDPIRVGFTLRWSHDGGISVRAEGFAQDTACTNSIRQITSPIHVKHSGDVDGRVDWRAEWQTVLDEIGAFSEALAAIIEEGMEFEFFDFTEDFDAELLDAADAPDRLHREVRPVGSLTERDVEGVFATYSLLGLPDYLAIGAADRLMTRLARTDDPRIASAWDAHSAATYALTHLFRGTPGASDDNYHRAVNDVLTNPQQAWETVETETRMALAEAGEVDRTMFAGLSAFDGEDEDVGDALRQYAERERELTATFGGT